jgi:hypothetical protein
VVLEATRAFLKAAIDLSTRPPSFTERARFVCGPLDQAIISVPYTCWHSSLFMCALSLIEQSCFTKYQQV